MSQVPVSVAQPDLQGIEDGNFQEIRNAVENLYIGLSTLALAIAGRVGGWRDVDYDATNFTANGGGAWTVNPASDQQTYAWIRIDDLLILAVHVIDTTIGAATSELRVALPAGFKSAKASRGTIVWSNATTPQTEIGAWVSTIGGTYLACQRADGGAALQAFPAVADHSLSFVAVLQILPRNAN